LNKFSAVFSKNRKENTRMGGAVLRNGSIVMYGSVTCNGHVRGTWQFRPQAMCLSRGKETSKGEKMEKEGREKHRRGRKHK
jgi:hypothetical protein